MDHHCSPLLYFFFTYLLLLSTYFLQPSSAAQVEVSSHLHSLKARHHHHELGSFCNPVEGCLRPSLTCHKNRCECAPGYGRSDENGKEAAECTRVVCQRHEDCNLLLDPGRRCHQGACSRCKDGLQLDTVVNRCISRLGFACNNTRDCLADSSLFPLLNTEDNNNNNISLIDDAESSPPICRSGRCVCRPNDYPNEDWSACQRRRRGCTSHSDCNPFGDDPYRYCSSSRGECLCKLGYYEEPVAGGLCLPYAPLQFSLMMPFWLTLIMLTICILVYVSRRLATSGRAAAVVVAAENGGSATTAVSTTATVVSPEVDALNRPPPSYETVVKTPATTVPSATPPAN